MKSIQTKNSSSASVLRLASRSSLIFGALALLAGIGLSGASTQSANAQSVWGGRADTGASEAAAKQKAESAEGASAAAAKEKMRPHRFVKLEMPDPDYLRGLRAAPVPEDGNPDWLIITRSGFIQMPAGSEGDARKAKAAWLDFENQQSIAPISGVELGLVSGVASEGRVVDPNGMGGANSPPQAYAVSKNAAALFGEDLSPTAIPVMTAEEDAPKKSSGWFGGKSKDEDASPVARGPKNMLGVRVVFADGYSRLNFLRNPYAPAMGMGSSSHYSLRDGEALVVAQVDGSVIHWAAMVAYPLPAGAIDALK